MMCMAKRVETQILTTAKIIGQRLFDAREALEPKMTQTDAAWELARIIPWSKPHSSTISRIEKGGSSNIYLVAALARIYNKTLAEVAPEYVHHAQTMYHVLEDVIDVSDKGERNSRCSSVEQLDLFSSTVQAADVRIGGVLWELSDRLSGNTSVNVENDVRSRVEQLVA